MFFAVDNTDFAEDTADGKDTTRGTITVVYQKDNATGEVWSALGREKAAALHVYSTHSQVQTMLGDFPDLAKQCGFNNTRRLIGKSSQH